jgi:hypothetical protein
LVNQAYRVTLVTSGTGISNDTVRGGVFVAVQPFGSMASGVSDGLICQRSYPSGTGKSITSTSFELVNSMLPVSMSARGKGIAKRKSAAAGINVTSLSTAHPAPSRAPSLL